MSVVVQDIVNEIRTLIYGATSYRPIFQRPIDRKKGIKITGTFYTNSTKDPSPFSYITVGRQNDKAVVHDGIGLAWRTGYVASGDYNIYLVDNNILLEDTPIRVGNMILEENLNNFLAYGSANIEPSTEYKFGIEIDGTWGIKVCVYSGTFVGDPNFATPFSDLNPSGYVMSMGARYDGYEPQATGDTFGVSVLGTEGSYWFYDNLRISSALEGYSATLLKFYAPSSSFDHSGPAQLYLKGTAQDGLGNYGLNWCLWNNDTSGWEVIALNSGATVTGIYYDIADLTSYVDGSDFVNILGIATAPGDDGVLYIDYAKLSTAPPSGVHAGHMTDIYVHAPTRITRETVTAYADSYTINFDDASIKHPIHKIETVWDVDLDQELLLDNADPSVRYVITNTAPHYTYSTKENLSIGIPTEFGTVDITYTYYEDGETIQTFLDSDANRVPTCDNLLKVCPPALITINQLDYRGGPEVEDMRDKIVTWINALVRDTFEITDLIAYLYTLGVSYLNLNTLDISVQVHNMSGLITAEESINSSYTITEPNSFYTDSTKLIGVTKL